MTYPYTQITAITNSFVDNKLVDAVFTKHALLARMKKKEELISGGDKIKKPIISADADDTNTGNFYSGSETLTQQETDDITAAYFDWKQIYESIVISHLDLAKNSGKEAVVSLIKSKVQIAENRMRTKMTKGLFSDGGATTGMNTTKQITGLQATMAQVSATGYGGIAEDDLATWVAANDTNSGTDRPLSLALIQKVMNAATEGIDSPTSAIMNRAVYNEFWNLLQPHQRLVNSVDMAKLGFKGILEFNGIPFLQDNLMVDNYMYFLNEDYLKLSVHKDFNMKRVEIPNREESDSSITRVHWYGNLTCSNRRFQGQLGDIQTA